MEPGKTGQAVLARVTEQHTAAAVESGTVAVFATPSMIALMEKAAVNAVAAHLEPGQTTVGTTVNIEHLAATPVGASVTATAEIQAVEGRKIRFSVTASDSTGQEIGRGVHERFILSAEKFLAKANARLEQGVQ